MPNLDKTGPIGKGPKTGKGLGNCDQPNSRIGQRRGRGLSQLFPWRRKFQNQVESMEEYYQFLQDELARVEKELNNSTTK